MLRAFNCFLRTSISLFKLSQKLQSVTQSNPDGGGGGLNLREFVSVDSDVLEVAAGDLSIVGWGGQGGDDNAGEHDEEFHFDILAVRFSWSFLEEL
jgi:hypothetical protein